MPRVVCVYLGYGLVFFLLLTGFLWIHHHTLQLRETYIPNITVMTATALPTLKCVIRFAIIFCLAVAFAGYPYQISCHRLDATVSVAFAISRTQVLAPFRLM